MLVVELVIGLQGPVVFVDPLFGIAEKFGAAVGKGLAVSFRKERQVWPNLRCDADENFPSRIVGVGQIAIASTPAGNNGQMRQAQPLAKSFVIRKEERLVTHD